MEIKHGGYDRLFTDYQEAMDCLKTDPNAINVSGDIYGQWMLPDAAGFRGIRCFRVTRVFNPELLKTYRKWARLD